MTGRPRVALSALLTAHTLSQTGNAITVLATPFYVLAQGGTGVEVGIAATFATVPIVLGGPLGGALVDRIGHRLSSVIADAASAVTLAAIAVLAGTGNLPFWGFLLLIFLSGLLDTPGNTARHVLLPPLATANRIALERTVGFATGVERVAMLVGAPLGGVLVSVLGPPAAFATTAVAFVIAATLVLVCVPRPDRAGMARADLAAVGVPRVSYWRDLVAGFRFVSAHPLLRLIVFVVFLINLLDAARFSVLLPIHAAAHLQGAVAVGLLTGALGGGALVGSLVYGFFGQGWPRRPWFMVALGVTGGPFSVALAVQAPFSVLIALAAVIGLAAGIINPIIGVLQLQLAPRAMRARVYSLMVAGSWAGVPIGALLAGIAAERIGLTASFIIIGVSYVIVSLAPLRGGAWTGMGPFPARPA